MAQRKTFLLRLDPKVYAALQKWAADELRSVNAQIDYILRRALKQAGRLDLPDHEDEEQDGPEQD
ncbi:MAG TPA: DNA-binding protein [Limnochorda sp.]